ncbi:hypothetical protein [Duganella qianjiadongensis]|uniref:Uncharacterized protein n=1 Tax=Duganella qianjiadongensis TaxID=2692176 RepID=A0ABW9VL94_9BURK|nr:hypothetical protein [Duganella qianjiadongensis]MYM39660.1 hypothetical protein [Duganella qianjiadongensis]
MSGAANPAVVYPAQLPPKAIVNGYSTSGWTLMAPPNGAPVTGLPQVGSGALTAGVLTTVLNVVGPGVMEFLSVVNYNATARTLRIQLVIDGVTVFDSTSGALSAAGVACLIGTHSVWSSGIPSVSLDAIAFNSSCVLKLASSLTEANPFYAQYAYRTV